MEDIIFRFPGGEEVAAVRYVIHTHSVFFRDLFENTQMKRNSDDKFVMNIELPFPVESFRLALEILHKSDAPFSMSPVTFGKVYKIFDYLNVDLHKMCVKLGVHPTNDDKLEYLNIYSDELFQKTNGITAHLNLDRCLRRVMHQSLVEWLEFVETTVPIIELWHDDDELIADHARTRIHEELRVASYNTNFWNDAISGGIVSEARVRVLMYRFPYAMIAFHARKHNIANFPASTKFECNIDQHILHTLINSNRESHRDVAIQEMAMTRTHGGNTLGFSVVSSHTIKSKTRMYFPLGTTVDSVRTPITFVKDADTMSAYGGKLITDLAVMYIYRSEEDDLVRVGNKEANAFSTGYAVLIVIT